MGRRQPDGLLPTLSIAQPDEWPAALRTRLEREVGERIDSQPAYVEWYRRHAFIAVLLVMAATMAQLLAVAVALGDWTWGLGGPLGVLALFALPLWITRAWRTMYRAPSLRLQQGGLSLEGHGLIPWADLVEVSTSGVLVVTYKTGSGHGRLVRPTPGRRGFLHLPVAWCSVRLTPAGELENPGSVPPLSPRAGYRTQR